jgi:ssDNA-binding Zn-finger/Zn-ribbon topoisomerase 1
LLKREYVAREQKALVATSKGMALITMLRSPLLTSAELTGQWEQKLARMVRGAYEREVFMREVRAMVADLVAQIAGTAMAPSATRSSVQTRGAAARPAGALDCPQCVAAGRTGGFLIERAGAHGPFLVCATGTEACGFITDKPKNATQRKALQQRKCPVCQGAMRLRLPKEKGKEVALACCHYPHCQGVRWFNGKGTLEQVRARPETGPPCPECGTPTVKRGPARTGQYFWSCARWRSDGSGCHARPVWITAARA